MTSTPTSTPTALAPTRPCIFRAILWGGFFCGALDITAAFFAYGSMGVRPERLLEGIAATLLGPSAFSGGWATALLGLFLHFVIATGTAAVYVFASLVLRFLTRSAHLAGPFYGIAVYFFMQFAVLPLSRIGRRPFSPQLAFTGIFIHMLCVGLPIALVARHFIGRTTAPPAANAPPNSQKQELIGK